MRTFTSRLAALVALFFLSVGLSAQVSCPAVVAGPDTTLSGPGCVLLQATPVSGFQPTTYTTQQIPYNPYPYNMGTGILLNIDDRWSSAIQIPFNFCFYGTTYNQLVIGSNGMISFDITNAGGGNQWQITAGIPSPNNPTNAIYAPFHDIDPSVAGTIRWALYGNAPCRVFVVSFENCAMFSCNNLIATQQIAIYETTNIIETYIQNKPTCGTWNSGAAIHGIQNATGTAATVVPGRNFPTQWTATNDAWRFVPAGAPNFTVNWYVNGNLIANTDTVTVCPNNCTVQYVSEVIYTNCNSTTVTVSDTATVTINNTNLNPNPNPFDVLCNGDSTGSVSVNPTGGIAPYGYVWNTGDTTASVTGLPAGTYTVVITDSAACVFFDTLTISEPPVLTNGLAGVPPPCASQSVGTATATPGGGVGPYTYNWSNGQTSATATGLGGGQHFVTVTDANSCTLLDTITLTPNPSPVVTITATTDVSCFGGNDGSATASGSSGTPPYVFLWSNAQTGATVNNLTAGNHSVVITDASGLCTDTAFFSISEPPLLAVTGTAIDVSCNGGSDGSATVVVSGGTQPYTYNWTPSGGNAATATNLSLGSYTCNITDDNGCQTSITLQVNQPAVQTITPFSQDETCLGLGDGSVSVIPSGGTPPYSYLWSTGAITQTVNNLSTGNYSVTVTDANGCVSTGSTSISAPAPPSADAGPDVSFCEGEGGATLTGTASGGTAPYYYTWTCAVPPCGLDSINDDDPLANPNTSMMYYLQVTDANGCVSALDSAFVTIIPKPQVLTSGDISICSQPATGTQLTSTISGSPGPYTYQWIPSAGLNNATIPNPFARPDTTTIYTLVVTDVSTGCTSDFNTLDTNSTVTVTVVPEPTADAGPDRDICFGDSTMLQGLGFGSAPPYTYQWSPSTGLASSSVPNPMASPAQTTIYTLVVSAEGCPSVGDSVTITVNQIPTVDAGPDRDICYGESVMLDGTASVLPVGTPTTLRWTPGSSLSDSTAEDPIAFPEVTTMYYLQSISPSGCESSLDSVLVTVRPTPIAEAGLNVTWCPKEGPLQLDGSYTWRNNNAPANTSNLSFFWGPVGSIVGSNTVEDPLVEPTTTTWFTFTVTNDSCSHTDSVLVTVLSEPFAEIEADTNSICSGDSLELRANGGLGNASFSWMPTTGLSNPNISNPLAAPSETTTYFVIVSQAGCSDTAEYTVNVIPTPVAAISSSFTEGCVPHTVNFLQTSSDGVFYIWDFGDSTDVSNDPNPEHVYNEAGTYTVSLTAIGPGGCADTLNDLTITVYDSSWADFNSDPNAPVELMLPNTEVQFFDASQNADSWNWTFSDGNGSSLEDPVYQFTEPGTYYVTLTTTNAAGCVSTVIKGPYVVKAPDLFIPNVFTPNGDDINDRFEVVYTGNQPFLLKIFDRWGSEVYQGRDKIEGWDGNLDGIAAPEGVYYYTIRVGDRDFNGSLTLAR